MALSGPPCILSIFDERVFHPPGTLGADRKSDYEHSTIFIQSKTDSARGLWVDQRMLLHNVPAAQHAIHAKLRVAPHAVRRAVTAGCSTCGCHWWNPAHLVLGLSGFKNAGSRMFCHWGQ
jgi:hypothetical protein